MANLLDLARVYVASGLSIIPIRADGSKAPAVHWKKYQTTRTTEDELASWFNTDNVGVGIVGGTISGNLEILDFDDKSVYQRFLELLAEMYDTTITAPIVHTPSGGFHIYYRTTTCGRNTKLAERPTADGSWETLIETRAEGGFVLAPGSPIDCHPDKKPYELLQGDLTDIPTISDEEREMLLSLARTFNEKPTKVVQTAAVDGNPHGQRNGQKGGKPGDEYNKEATWPEILTPHGWELAYESRGVGFWRRPGKRDRGISATSNYGGSGLLYVFSSNGHPFESGCSYSKFAAHTLLNHDGDFHAAARDLASKGYGTQTSNKSSSQRDKLIQCAADFQLWRDEEGKAYATIPVGDHIEHHSIKSPKFRQTLISIYYQQHKSGLSAQAQSEAIATLEARAVNEGIIDTPALRVAKFGETIYLDLCTEDWKVVEIDSEGHRVVTNANCPVPFIRRKGMLPLPVPIASPADVNLLESLRQLLSIDANTWRLILSCAIACFRPALPYPVLRVTGEQGCGKSLLLELLRTLVDPNKAPLRSLPREERDLFVALNNGHVLSFDNVSKLPDWLSDALCRISTGAGFASRTLYENDEETLFAGERPVWLNGIGSFVTRGDLQERTISVSLPVIPPDKRKTKEEIIQWFDLNRPALLHELLDIVVTGLRNLPSVKPFVLPRMADFAKLGAAIAPALGWTAEDFLKAYDDIKMGDHTAQIDDSLVATLIIRLAKPWEGSPSELLKQLKTLANDAEQKNLPKTPDKLSGELSRLAPALRALGIQTVTRRTGKKRIVELYQLEDPDIEDWDKVSSPASPPSQVPPVNTLEPSNDASDEQMSTVSKVLTFDDIR